MKKVVVFRESVLSATEFASRLDRYLAQANETFKPFDGQIEYSWNDRRDRVSIHCRLFTAEIMHLVMKGVVVVAALSVVAYPFKRQIEERIDHALKAIFENDEGD